jgi:hypothetical protein
MSSAAVANSVDKIFPEAGGDIADLSQAVAAALDVSAGQVVIGNEKCVWDERSIKFTGHADGQEFFAKMLIADPYPVNSAVPWHQVLIAFKHERSAECQVKLEALARTELGQVMDVSAIAECRGSSMPFRTIVWERLSGTSVLGLLRRSRLFDPLGKTCRAIAFEAGTWLRQLHDTTQQGTEELRVGESIDTVVRQIPSKNNSASTKRAVELLRCCAERLGSSLLTQVSRNHGDFTLVNLILDHSTHRLYVTDFENSEYAATWQDLASITFSLRKQLLNPLIPAQIVRGMEQSFWDGYGDIAPELFQFIQALATSRILVHCPERVETGMDRRAWTKEIAGSLYRSFVRTKLMSRAVPGLAN